MATYENSLPRLTESHVQNSYDSPRKRLLTDQSIRSIVDVMEIDRFEVTLLSKEDVAETAYSFDCNETEFNMSQLIMKDAISFDQNECSSICSLVEDLTDYVITKSTDDEERSNFSREEEENVSHDDIAIVKQTISGIIEEDACDDSCSKLSEEDYAEGYDFPTSFKILGVIGEDKSGSQVLSSHLMESLQCFLPYRISEQNFWLKFSLSRDGASLQSLLEKVSGSSDTIMAIETVDGDVFGSFTSSPWKKQFSYFGSGEAFLWRMRRSRKTSCQSLLEQFQLESEIDVYPWTGKNDMIQSVTTDRLALGGGTEGSNMEKNFCGFGLTIDSDLYKGSSDTCCTFDNMCLSRLSDGSTFKIANLEVWTFTPCETEQDAEKLESKKLFAESAWK